VYKLILRTTSYPPKIHPQSSGNNSIEWNKEKQHKNRKNYDYKTFTPITTIIIIRMIIIIGKGCKTIMRQMNNKNKIKVCN
jgi:hypothetical protein